MVNYALIVKDGVVVNRVKATVKAAELNGWIVDNVAQIGWVKDGEGFVAPPVIVDVPDSIGMDQARLVLHDEGLTEAVEAAIDALPPAQQKRVKIEWNTRQVVRRKRGLVNKVLKAVGLSNEEIDNLFILAETL